MWVELKQDVYNEEYGLLPAGKKRNINSKLAKELVDNGKAINPDDNKMDAPDETK